MFYIFSPKHYQHRMYTYICNNIITSWKKFEIKRLSIIDFSFEINEAFFYFLTRCRCRTKLLFLAESSSVFVQSTDWGFLNQTDRKKTRRYSQNFNSSNALWRWFFFFFAEPYSISAKNIGGCFQLFLREEGGQIDFDNNLTKYFFSSSIHMRNTSW